MKLLPSIAAILATLSVAPVFGQGAPGATAAPGEPPAAPGPGASTDSESGGSAGTSAHAQAGRPDLDAQLEAARRRLDEAARQVAELSAQRGQAFMRQYSFLSGPPRAIIGAQLENQDGGTGARVLEVSPGGPAAEAGIRAGDVITAVNGTEVKGADAARQVGRLVRDVTPESKVRLEVSRNGKAQQFTVTARRGPAFEFFGPGPEGPGMPAPGAPAAPAAPPAPPAFPFGPGSMFLVQGPLADMELATLTPRLGSYFGTDKGVLVVRAPEDGALKLEDGDVILSIDGRVPTSGTHATRILGSYQPGEKIDLRIVRERKRMDIATTMPDRPQRARNRVYFRSGGFSVPQGPGRVIIRRGSEAI
ncbi:MAG TPA: PDZ domain-containing protein [Steroidobacteraceae bacterium]